MRLVKTSENKKLRWIAEEGLTLTEAIFTTWSGEQNKLQNIWFKVFDDIKISKERLEDSSSTDSAAEWEFT